MRIGCQLLTIMPHFERLIKLMRDSVWFCVHTYISSTAVYTSKQWRVLYCSFRLAKAIRLISRSNTSDTVDLYNRCDETEVGGVQTDYLKGAEQRESA